MGYYSTLEGQVGISKDSYEKMMAEKIKYENRELLLSDCLREIQHDGSCVYIYSEGKHYYINEIMTLLAKYKDSEDIDEVAYYGEDPDDAGSYYIGVGRWCFVPVIVPPPPTDPNRWIYVAKE